MVNVIQLPFMYNHDDFITLDIIYNIFIYIQYIYIFIYISYI